MRCVERVTSSQHVKNPCSNSLVCCKATFLYLSNIPPFSIWIYLQQEGSIKSRLIFERQSFKTTEIIVNWDDRWEWTFNNFICKHDGKKLAPLPNLLILLSIDICDMELIKHQAFYSYLLPFSCFDVIKMVCRLTVWLFNVTPKC